MNHILVAVRTTDLVKVSDALSVLTGHDTWPAFGIGITIDVLDVSEGVRIVADALATDDLEDDNQAWREFDSTRFGVDVSLKAFPDTVGEDLAILVGCALAKSLSKRLSTTCVVSKDGGAAPVAAYEHGKRTRCY